MDSGETILVVVDDPANRYGLPYGAARSTAGALDEIRRAAKRHFDPDLAGLVMDLEATEALEARRTSEPVHA